MTQAERLKNYERLSQQALNFNPAQAQQDFEKAYGEATNYNKDLIDERAGVMGQMQSLPAEMRAQYAQSAIRNPLEQEALIAQRRGALQGDLSRLTDFLGARGSRYEDVLRSHMGMYQTQAEQARMAAENEWRMYQDLVQQDQFNRQMAKGSGGGGGGIDLGSIIELLTGGGQPQQEVRQPSAQEQFTNAVQRIRDQRSVQNIESQMNLIHKRLLEDARKMGLNVDPSALWVWLGNTNKQGPFTPILFK